MYADQQLFEEDQRARRRARARAQRAPTSSTGPQQDTERVLKMRSSPSAPALAEAKQVVVKAPTPQDSPSPSPVNGSPAMSPWPSSRTGYASVPQPWRTFGRVDDGHSSVPPPSASRNPRELPTVAAARSLRSVSPPRVRALSP